MKTNILKHNRSAWDAQVEKGNLWTIPANKTAIDEARQGRWTIFLTPQKAVPHAWMPGLSGKRVLCLASGGGQQGPVLAAAGAKVTVFDNSPKQLEQDTRTARENGLFLQTVQGDMADLNCFGSGTFDYIVHPVSNTFVPDVRPVWKEAFRVLKPGGALLAGFDNPIVHVFDPVRVDRGELFASRSLPHSDADRLSEAEISERLAKGDALEFGHLLEDQIGGQLDAGFLICGFFEDRDPPDQNTIARLMPHYIATRALKPA